jgi:hypothetical protein
MHNLIECSQLEQIKNSPNLAPQTNDEQLEDIDDDVAYFNDLEDFEFEEERYADFDDHFNAEEFELSQIETLPAIPSNLHQHYFDWAENNAN